MTNISVERLLKNPGLAYKIFDAMIRNSEIIGAIDRLRNLEEGASVELVSDSRDFGSPSCVVSISNSHTDWEYRRFHNETIYACLCDAELWVADMERNNAEVLKGT